MNNYMLTIRIRFDSDDDVAAREEAEEVMEAIGYVPTKEVFLQQVRQNKPPRRVRYEYKSPNPEEALSDCYDYYKEDPGCCARCGKRFEFVRPGKSQPNCTCWD